MKQGKVPLVSFGFLLVAIFIAGCASPGKQVSDGAWSAFEAAGPRHNRLQMLESCTVTPETFARLGLMAVVAATNDRKVQIQVPLTGCKAAWRGAKLWLLWERPVPARRLPRGQPTLETPQPKWSQEMAQACLSGAAEGAAPLLLMGYAMYIPVGGIIGAISGAAGCPSQNEMPQVLHVASNTLAAAGARNPLALEFLTQLQGCDRDVTAHPDLVVGEGPSVADSFLEVTIVSIRLEGGRNPNARLWLTVEWAACLRRAASPTPDFWLRGVWQSDKKQTLLKWVVDGGSPLGEPLGEACRQIAAAALQQMMPCRCHASEVPKGTDRVRGKTPPQDRPRRLASPRG